MSWLLALQGNWLAWCKTRCWMSWTTGLIHQGSPSGFPLPPKSPFPYTITHMCAFGLLTAFCLLNSALCLFMYFIALTYHEQSTRTLLFIMKKGNWSNIALMFVLSDRKTNRNKKMLEASNAWVPVPNTKRTTEKSTSVVRTDYCRYTLDAAWSLFSSYIKTPKLPQLLPAPPNRCR